MIGPVESSDPYQLQRFVDAQEISFGNALAELRAGSKQSHWMWFIFPQLADLGRSPTAKHFGIVSIGEAQAFLEHPLLGARLRACAEALLQWSGRRSAEQVLGAVDAMKLRSSATLFDRIEPAGIFEQLLLNFFGGRRDELTLALLDRPQ
jgi:uncharacterized protein (DUF1810 family)